MTDDEAKAIVDRLLANVERDYEAASIAAVRREPSDMKAYLAYIFVCDHLSFYRRMGSVSPVIEAILRGRRYAEILCADPSRV